MKPTLARRWILAGYQYLLSVKQAGLRFRCHGEDECLDLERTSPGLFPPSYTGSRTLLRLVVTSRRAVLVWRPASSDAGLRSSYHVGAGNAQEAKAQKARRQSTSMMKPFLCAITVYCIDLNMLAASRRATVGRKIFWVPPIFSFDGFLWGEQTCSHRPLSTTL
jgi:hypothetical protein